MRNPARGGASVSLAGDTESPTPKAAETQPATSSMIATLRFWEPPELLAVRSRLERAAIITSVRAQRALSPDAIDQYWLMNRMAARWMRAAVGVETLADCADHLLRQYCVADWLEQNGSGLE